MDRDSWDNCGWGGSMLQREIPMAWDTTTDSLTLEINPFQYAIEIKTSNTKGSDLVPYSGLLK